jgi:predicted acetyltransferase
MLHFIFFQNPPALEKKGGHIGYYIRPSQRGKGYGNLILHLSLEKARELGLKRVLVTCDDNNDASLKTIENNGGKLVDKIKGEGSVVLTRRYWIDLDKGGRNSEQNRTS